MTLKPYLIAFALLSAGMIAGMLTNLSPGSESGGKALTSQPALSREDEPSATNNAAVSQSNEQANLERIQTLENALIALETRLANLERDNTAAADGSQQPEADDPGIAANAKAAALPTALPTFDALIAAGVDAFTAREITDRQSSLQLARLELRDQALREGFLGTERYRESLQQIRAAEVQIRNEVNDTAYDQYLFHTGQNNRVAVESVILGSNAEKSGIMAGDMILRYEDKPLYNFGDLRSATIEGEKDEIVSVTVLRGEDQVTVSMPRGPLGVRLNFLRVRPQES